MRRALPFLFVAVLLAACTAPALAGGVSMSWGNYCSWSEGGPTSLTWYCRNDTTTRIRMTCSFRPIRTHPAFVGLHVTLVGMTEASSVPDWWQLGDGGCREGALTLSTDGSAMAGGPSVCADPWGGAAVGTLGEWEIPWPGSNRIEVTADCSLVEPVPIEAERQYFACQFRVDASGTVSGECGGCLAPWIFALYHIELRFAGGTPPEMLDSAPAHGYRCLIYNNCGLSDMGCYSDTGVPTRSSTWGQIKSLYR